jgi:hypothetical protein
VSGVVACTLLLLLLLMLMLLPVWQYLSMCNLRSMITWNCWTNGGLVRGTVDQSLDIAKRGRRIS